MTQNETLEKTAEDYIEDVEVEDVLPELSVEHGEETPSFSLKEAALLLGKCLRSLERSLTGRWGNKLPDGWSAAKKIGRWKRGMVHNAAARLPLRSPGRCQEKSGGSSPVQHIIAEELFRPLRNHFEMSTGPEVTSLLKELSNSHRELAEQRKLHVEDLRTLLELQSSMRRLEVNASETSKLREELVAAQKDLVTLRDKYLELANQPWWKRLFRKA